MAAVMSRSTPLVLKCRARLAFRRLGRRRGGEKTSNRSHRLSMGPKGKFTKNTDVSSSKCTYTSIIRFSRVKIAKMVYICRYSQKGLNGFMFKSVQIFPSYQSVLLAHLHLIGVILQTPGSMIDLEPACDARKEVRQAVNTKRALAQKP
jgi:hypothetical protein